MAEIKTIGESLSQIVIEIDTKRFSDIFKTLYGIGYMEYLDEVKNHILKNKDDTTILSELKDRIEETFEIFKKNNMTKIIESIKFDGINLNDIFKLECVDGIIKGPKDEPLVFVKHDYTEGRCRVNKGDYICKFSNGMWQVFGQEAYMNEIKK